jgi:hypothetical protein
MTGSERCGPGRIVVKPEAIAGPCGQVLASRIYRAIEPRKFRGYYPAMVKSIYISGVATLLFLSALCHIFLQSQTAHWMSKPGLVRLVGGGLLLLALPCLWWRGSYFWILFAALVVSGAWRLFSPRHSIRAQEWSYPRWVHGCLLLAGAIAVWALRP